VFSAKASVRPFGDHEGVVVNPGSLLIKRRGLLPSGRIDRSWEVLPQDAA
jgi:hypothetical protein